jgi:hypothetical protein
MNLIVQDGLKEVDATVIKVRESVKYFKGSQARKQRFLGCVAHVELQSGKGLKQDVPTRWNSTYLMFDSDLYYKKTLIHFQKVDANYVHCPSMEEWARVEKFFKFLKVFYEATLAFFGTKYPISNLYFPNVLRVRLLLKDLTYLCKEWLVGCMRSLRNIGLNLAHLWLLLWCWIHVLRCSLFNGALRRFMWIVLSTS